MTPPESEPATLNHQTDNPPPEMPELPPGDHPLEIAARKGLGPLSPLGGTVWHGDSVPCVTCGQLVQRSATDCDECGQDLSEEMLARMKAHAGPWYVLEHVRPFPGVSLDLIVRQIRRGLITETSIVRGPATDFQWRYAVETPGLCRYFNRCWHCHSVVTQTDTYCQGCLSSLASETRAEPKIGAAGGAAVGARVGGTPVTATGGGASGTLAAQPARAAGSGLPSSRLGELSAALTAADLPPGEDVWDAAPRVAGLSATWIAVLLVVLMILALWIVTTLRGSGSARTEVVPAMMTTLCLRAS